MINKIHNFNAGPSILPVETLKEVHKELFNYNNSGISILETSHRSKEYEYINNNTKNLIKKLYKIPNNFEILFLQGGATLQFSMIPLNLLNNKMRGAYICTGEWSNKAYLDSKFYGNTYKIWDGKNNGYTKIPDNEKIIIENNTSYLHITTNETINGIRFINLPNVEVPLILDLSSDLFVREIEWNKIGLAYGGIQKNLGPSGITIIIIDKNILDNINNNISTYLNYKEHIKKNSILNTPTVFSVYFMMKVLELTERNGGLIKLIDKAKEKSEIIYTVIDNSYNYYSCPIQKKYRSLINIIFTLPTKELENKFLTEAKINNFIGLDGHRNIGGCRISCYNAMPIKTIKLLLTFMKNFKFNNPK